MKIDLTLPLPAEMFIPHRPPMRLVETLISYGAAAGLVEAVPAADGILVDADGVMDEVALVELLAQGYAVIKGYDDLLNGKEISKGFLVGVRKLRIAGRARAGERLLVRIRTVGSFEGFAVAEGEVVRNDEVIASGTIKLWIVADAGAAAPAGGQA
jgi:3-hydroxyacyl-[acyl-carrier-protein] dehydratase